MPRIEIVSAGVVVGTLDAEFFDDGMGVAHGSFKPGEAYAVIRNDVIAASEQRALGIDASGPELTARAAGEEIIQSAFVTITEYEDSQEPEAAVQFGDRKQWLRVERCT
jgi:hypothetical protein